MTSSTRRGALSGTLNATVLNTAVTWTWNAGTRHADRRPKITGNDTAFLNGFIWYDDFELKTAAAVPEPASDAAETAGSMPWPGGGLVRKRRGAVD